MNCKKLSVAELNFLSSIYLEYKRSIHTYIWHLTEHSPDTEDIVSDVFLIACEKCERLMSHPNPAGFLHTTARNKVIEYKRRFARKTELMNRISEDAPSTFSYVMESNDYMGYVESNIKEVLSCKEYRLFKSRYLDKLGIREIAEKEGISQASVYTRISRLKAKLNSKVKD